MEPQTVIRSNWLTLKPKYSQPSLHVAMTVVLCLLSYTYIGKMYGSDVWMPANYELVFNQHQYYRLWTTLFAHADFGHIFSNAALLIPLGYLLTSYYGYFLFPVLGLFLGGVINFFVLKSMAPTIFLIGISGVVYWMGAVWLTLYFLVDRRDQPKRRFAHVLFITVMLFIPQAYKPEVSYMAHLYGFIFGILTAFVFYFLNRQKFLNAEVREVILPDDFIIEAVEDRGRLNH